MSSIDIDLIKLIKHDSLGRPAELKQLVMQANSLASQRIDLREAIGALDLMRMFGGDSTPKTEGHDFKYAVLGPPCDIRAFLFITALILYGRCFNGSQERFRQGEGILKERKELLEIHRNALSRRDRFAAHYIDVDSLDDRTFLRLQYNAFGQPEDNVWFPFFRLAVFSQAEQDLFYQLASYVHDQVDTRLNALTPQLLGQLLLWKRRDEWLKLKDELAPKINWQEFGHWVRVNAPTSVEPPKVTSE